MVWGRGKKGKTIEPVKVETDMLRSQTCLGLGIGEPFVTKKFLCMRSTIGVKVESLKSHILGEVGNSQTLWEHVSMLLLHRHDVRHRHRVVEWHFGCEEDEGNNSHGEYVRFEGAVWNALEDLVTGVSLAPAERLRESSHTAFHLFGEAKVGHDELIRAPDEKILQLEVAVSDSL